jgi:transposase
MKTKRRKTVKRKPVRWRNSFYVKAYMMALEGMRDGKIAAALGVSRVTFLKWKKADKSLRWALRQARKKLGKSRTATFSDYVTNRLPEHLRPIWNQLEATDTLTNPEKRVEALLAGHGEDVRKQLFVHAFVSSNFNKAEACRRANVSYKTINRWMQDEEFVQLCDQLFEMKRDFVEGCLMGLVGSGDTAATIFAAKALLGERGYNPKQVVEHTGQVKHSLVKFEDLPLDLRKQILEWSEKNGHDDTQMGMLPSHHDAEDAEYEEVK